MKVLFALVSLGLVAGSIALGYGNIQAKFDVCCDQSNLDDAQKTEIMDTVLSMKDPGGFNAKQKEALGCTAKAMEVVNGGTINMTLITMAAGDKMSPVQRKDLTTCMTGIKGQSDGDATIKGIQCANSAMG